MLSACWAQAEQAEESSVAYRGLYVFRFNAENLIKPYDTMVSRKPDLSLVSLSQEMHVALSSKTTAVAAGVVTKFMLYCLAITVLTVCILDALVHSHMPWRSTANNIFAMHHHTIQQCCIVYHLQSKDMPQTRRHS